MDWIRIKNEYINGNISYRKLAEKYGISVRQIANVAKAEKWVELKKEQHNKISLKLQQKTADKIVDRNLRLLEISDKLTSKIDKAVGELDMRLTEDGKINVDMVEVDKLNKLTKALKDIRDIQATTDVNNQNGNLEKLIQGLKTDE